MYAKMNEGTIGGFLRIRSLTLELQVQTHVTNETEVAPNAILCSPAEEASNAVLCSFSNMDLLKRF